MMTQMLDMIYWDYRNFEELFSQRPDLLPRDTQDYFPCRQELPALIRLNCSKDPNERPAAFEIYEAAKKALESESMRQKAPSGQVLLHLRKTKKNSKQEQGSRIFQKSALV